MSRIISGDVFRKLDEQVPITTFRNCPIRLLPDGVTCGVVWDGSVFPVFAYSDAKGELFFIALDSEYYEKEECSKFFNARKQQLRFSDDGTVQAVLWKAVDEIELEGQETDDSVNMEFEVQLEQAEIRAARIRDSIDSLLHEQEPLLQDEVSEDSVDESENPGEFDLFQFIQEVNADIQALREKHRSDLEQLRTEQESRIEELRAKYAGEKSEVEKMLTRERTSRKQLQTRLDSAESAWLAERDELISGFAAAEQERQSTQKLAATSVLPSEQVDVDRHLLEARGKLEAAERTNLRLQGEVEKWEGISREQGATFDLWVHEEKLKFEEATSALRERARDLESQLEQLSAKLSESEGRDVFRFDAQLESLSNNDIFRRAKIKFSRAMEPYVVKSLESSGFSMIEFRRERGTRQSSIADGRHEADFSALTRIMSNDAWDNVFGPKLGKERRSYLFELRNLRNDDAHVGASSDDVINSEDLYRALDCMVRILRAVSFDSQAAELVPLRDRVFYQLYVAKKAKYSGK